MNAGIGRMHALPRPLPRPLPRWMRMIGRSVMQRSAPLTMLQLHYGYLPARFMYAGAEHRVQRVERSWEAAGGFGKADRRYFRIRCITGRRYTIAQNLRAGSWHVVNVRSGE